jgi:hypothetical protein
LHAAEPSFRRDRIENTSVIKALGSGTTQGDQMAILELGFHPFRHHRDAKGSGQTDHCPHNGFILPIRSEPIDKGAIDLEDGDWETAQIAERGVAGAEIIHRQAKAELIQSLDGVHGDVDVINQHCFGDFEEEISHWHPRPGEHSPNPFSEIGILKTSA